MNTNYILYLLLFFYKYWYYKIYLFLVLLQTYIVPILYMYLSLYSVYQKNLIIYINFKIFFYLFIISFHTAHSTYFLQFIVFSTYSLSLLYRIFFLCLFQLFQYDFFRAYIQFHSHLNAISKNIC